MKTAITSKTTPSVVAGVHQVGSAGHVARIFFYLGLFTVGMLSIRPLGPTATLSDIFFIVSAFLAIPTSQRPPRIPAALVLGAFLMALAGVTATFLAEDAVASLGILLRLLFVMMVLPWTATRVLRSRADILTSIWVLLASGAVFSAVSIAQSFNRSLVEYFGESTGGRIIGLAEHPTDAGGFLAVCLALGLGMLNFVRGWRAVSVAVTVGAIVSAMVLAGSVSSFIASGLVLITMLVVGRRRILVVVAVSIICLGAVAYATGRQDSALSVSPIERITSSTSGKYNTAASRVDTYRFALNRLDGQPLVGVGLDPESGLTVQQLQVHNALLLFWYQGGVIALGAFLTFCYFCLTALLNSIRIDGKTQEGVCLTLAFLSVLLFSQTSPIMVQRYFWIVPALVVAYLLRAGHPGISSETDSSLAAPPRRDNSWAA